MGSRTLTSSPITYFDWGEWQPGKPVVVTEPDKVVTDLEWMWFAHRNIISDSWNPTGVTSGSYVAVATYTLDNKDSAGHASYTNVEVTCWVLAWASNGTTGGTIQLTTSADSGTASMTAGTTSPTYFQISNVAAASNGTEETWTINLKRDSGSGAIYTQSVLVAAESIT